MQTTDLAPGYTISRLIRGGWQLAGGHGDVDPERAVAGMAAFLDAGVTTFDCADIYTGVEELIGRFRQQLLAERGAEALARLKVHTKLVPDLAALPKLDRAYVTAIVDRSLRRLRAERLDLVQLHWWDYAVPGLIDCAGWLVELQRAGKIDRLGGTNFDSARTAALVDAGVPLAAMQVQYSLLDRRPEHGLAAVCAARGVGLLCYGTLAGGLLAERWQGVAEPPATPANRSLVKYLLIVEELGGWALFQGLLAVLAGIARRHGCGIANVATRWALDRPGVAAVIVGARDAGHLPENLRTFEVGLDDADRAAIDAVLARAKGPAGDTYALERDRAGRHGRIMRYDLNAAG
jgi:aryl-alcohol dehydrogenase-like predicted oxidoreductase